MKRGLMAAATAHKARLLLIIAGLIILGGAILTVHKLRGPSVGTITPVGQNIENQPSEKDKFISGKYISFKYPGELVSKSVAPSGVILENFSLASKNIPFWNVTVTVQPLASGNLADNSAYAVRLQDPNHYSLSTIEVGNQSYQMFSDLSGGYAKLVFVQNKDKLATVSLTSIDSLSGAKFDDALKTVLASFKWLQP